jgi:hypothetical protein
MSKPKLQFKSKCLNIKTASSLFVIASEANAERGNLRGLRNRDCFVAQHSAP